MLWSAFSGLLGVLLGLFLGNRLALGRDKRKEFNDATSELRERLKKHIDWLEEGQFQFWIERLHIDRIHGLLGEKRTREIERVFQNYKQAYDTVQEGYSKGEPVDTKDVDNLLAAAKELANTVESK